MSKKTVVAKYGGGLSVLYPIPTPLSAGFLQVDKHRLVQDLCIRYRDVLTLDPTVPLPYPACLLIRWGGLVAPLPTWPGTSHQLP